VGLITGGLLTRYASWEYIFLLNVPVGLTALVLAYRLVPESRRTNITRRYDALGAATVTAGLLLAVYVISTAPREGWASSRSIGLALAAAALLVAFFAIESRVAQPLLPLGMFRSRSVASANLVGFALGGSFYAFLFVGTLYMQQVLGFTALQTGLAWLITSVTSVAMAAISQRLTDRAGAGPVMAAGMLMIAGGIAWATRVPVEGHLWPDLVGPLLIAGAGTAFGFIPISVAGLSGVAQHQAGVASGLLNTAQQVGGALGVAIASTVAATRTGTDMAHGAPRLEALTSGFHGALWVCCAIALLAVPIGILVPRPSRMAEIDLPDVEPAAGIAS
jgi:MFS family permease